ncbi:putative gustatory receptor 28b [Topomyia yanbarensis]|uniref:putative gustatory receptor 28b n=1 Tax=Topomyia yanbarensis TaxID=2498891 RepID=UPI00273C1D74|nr:putative gustatory receptor 28b [Topomyia yanbarensis]
MNGIRQASFNYSLSPNSTMFASVKNLLENLRRHETFFDVLWIGHWISDKFGLSPLEYSGQNKLPTYKRVPYAYLFAVFVQIAIFVLYIKADTVGSKSSSVILRYGMRCVLLVGTLFLVISTSLNVCFRKRGMDNLLDIHKFDLKLKTIGYQIDLKAQNHWFNMLAIWMTVFLWLIIAVAAYLTYLAMNGILITFVVVFVGVSITNIMVTTLCGQHAILQYAVQYRFKSLNRYLCEIFPTEMELVNHFRLFYISQERSVNSRRVVEIANLHSRLIQIVDRFNQHTGIQILLTHLGATCVTILSWFTMYTILVNADSVSVYMGIHNFLWSVYYVIYQMFNAILGQMIHSESKRMGKLIHKAVGFVTDDEIREKLVHFSDQIHQRTAAVSCEWFAIDSALIFSTLGAITTYLVILIQFDVTYQQLYPSHEI